MRLIAADNTLSSLTTNPYVLLVAGAFVSFLFSSVIEWRKRKKLPRKILAWKVQIDGGTLPLSKSLQGKLRVLYESQEMKAPTHVRFHVANTGSALVRDEYIRFVFPTDAKVVEFNFDPAPEAELDVEDVSDTHKPSERRIRVGHLESGQAVNVGLVSDGGDWTSWSSGAAFHPFNAEGNVRFERQSTVRSKADQERVSTFLASLVLLLTIPPIIQAFPLGEIAGVLSFMVACALLLTLLPNLMPFVRVVESVLSGMMGDRRGEIQIDQMVTENAYFNALPPGGHKPAMPSQTSRSH